jgi:hypothetical protein
LLNISKGLPLIGLCFFRARQVAADHDRDGGATPPMYTAKLAAEPGEPGIMRATQA